MIAPDERQALQPYLLPDERILWTGRPKQGIAPRWLDLFLVPLGLFFAGFAIVWNYLLWSHAFGPFVAFDLLFMLVGGGILVFGFYACIGRFLHEAWLRRRLLYAVTTRRILVSRTGRWPHLSSVELGYLPMLEFDEHRSGLGTLRFDLDDEDEAHWLRWWWVNYRGYYLWIRPLQRLSGRRFDHIEQPRAVYDLVRREADRCRRERGEQPASRYSFVG